jgi:menaquinone-dependent protoporphyrinogen oxidase
MTVLVVYASRTGSAREVAVEIADRLREHGLAAEVRLLTGAEDVSGYDDVVVGSALYSGAWLPEATEFVRRNEAALAERRVWTFTVGRRCDATRRRRENWGDSREIAEIHRAIVPLSHHFFPAITDPAALSRRQRVRLRSLSGGYGDFRKRPEVLAWSNTVARQLLVDSWSERVPALAS